MANDITVTVATRGRYTTTLPLCLMSIVNQTLKPKCVIVVDDNDKKEFYNIEILKDIIVLFQLNNIQFKYYHGESIGQVAAQQIALDHTETEWVFKTDDDNILSCDVLELLMSNVNDDVGCLSGLILSKNDILKNRKIEYNDSTYNRVRDIYRYFNIQMCPNQDNSIKEVEHIYSNYFFRKNLIDNYPLELSPAGHREDTITTYNIFKKGYKLLIVPDAKIWHLEIDGGNKIHGYSIAIKNEKIFLEKLKEWGININIIDKGDRVCELRNDGEWIIYMKI